MNELISIDKDSFAEIVKMLPRRDLEKLLQVNRNIFTNLAPIYSPNLSNQINISKNNLIDILKSLPRKDVSNF